MQFAPPRNLPLFFSSPFFNGELTEGIWDVSLLLGIPYYARCWNTYVLRSKSAIRGWQLGFG